VTKRYRVALHAHASAEVFVEASSPQEANRLALEEVKAGRAKVHPVKQWTPVATSDLSRER
jgi:predicted RecB family endonuclease